jgi:hypothetical protein
MLDHIDVEHCRETGEPVQSIQDDATPRWEAVPCGTKSMPLLRTLDWLPQKWPEPVISLPDWCQRGPNAICEAKSARQVVAALERQGWLVRLPQGAEIAGTHRREVWRIVRGVIPPEPTDQAALAGGTSDKASAIPAWIQDDAESPTSGLKDGIPSVGKSLQGNVHNRVPVLEGQPQRESLAAAKVAKVAKAAKALASPIWGEAEEERAARRAATCPVPGPKALLI